MMRLVMDAPENVANAFLHWRTLNRLKRLYREAQDQRQLLGLLPPPPPKPYERVRITADFRLWNTMDPDNLTARTKWAIDWLRTRGYIAGDTPQHITKLEVTQQIDRQSYSRVIVTLAPDAEAQQDVVAPTQRSEI